MNTRYEAVINEEGARVAHEMMSFDPYREGSKTAAYRSDISEAYELAAKVRELKGDNQGDRADRLADRYARKLGEYYNREIRIGMMCPSVMISGAGNFPVRKKEKQIAAFDQNMKNYQYCQDLLEKLKRMMYHDAPVMSGDDDAIERLEEKLHDLEESQAMMKNVNAYYRKNKTLEGCTDISEKMAAELEKAMSLSWHHADVPFASFSLTNNNANIKRTRDRLESLRKAKEAGNSETDSDVCKVIENADLMRIQLVFDGKPEPEVREILKSNGFKWAPSQSAWQRVLNNNGRYAAKRAIEKIKALTA